MMYMAVRKHRQQENIGSDVVMLKVKLWRHVEIA